MIILTLIKLHFKLIYFFLKFFKTKNKVTMISRQSNKISQDFSMIKEEIEKRDKDTEVVVLCRRATNNNAKEILSMYPETLKQMYHIATSRVVIIDSYCLPISILHHKKNLYVMQIWHSIGKIKKSSYQIFHTLKWYQKIAGMFMNLHRGYTNVVAAGPKFNKYYAECFKINEDIILNYGLPRIDYLINNEDKIKKRIYSKHPELKGKKIVLYAPTFRKYEPSGYYDLLKKYNKDDFILIIKSHPSQLLNVPLNIYTIDDFTATELITISDYVVTDYSSISIEAALLNKKTLYYLYDYDKYNEITGLNVDPVKTMQNNCVFDIDTLINRIKIDKYDIKEFNKYRKDYLPNNLGTSTKLIVDKVLEEVSMKEEKQVPFYKRLRRKIFSKKFRKNCRSIKRWLKRVGKKTLAFKLGRAVKVVCDKSYFPDMKRKNALSRYWDNVVWIFRYGRVNYSYNLFGLDIKNFRNQNDYVDVKYVKKDRMKQHHKNDPLAKHRPENITVRYSLLADNKHVFYSYMDAIKEGMVPHTYMIIQGEKVVSPLDSELTKMDTKKALKTLNDGKYICKACIGAFGASISVIEKKNNKIIINNGKKTWDEFVKETSHEPYLIQSYVEQHEAISKINPGTVNTVRIITTRWNNDTHVLAAMLRLGATKDQLVDNASNGGTFVGINYKTGKLMEYGYYYDRPREAKHPISGVVYKDYQIPYWEDIIKLLKELHPILFGFATIGWDIAITPTGPIIIEINWNYSVKGIQISSGGFRKRWDELKKK